MNSDYDDVEKLLSHMHLKDFAYRSFKHGESSPPLRVVRSADPPAPPAPPAAAVPPVQAVPVRRDTARVEPVLARPQIVTPPPAAAVPAVVAAVPVPAVPANPTVAASRISDTLERLMRGSIADRAPEVNLHLELPSRPALPEVAAPEVKAERSIGDMFRRLDEAAVLPPKSTGRGER